MSEIEEKPHLILELPNMTGTFAKLSSKSYDFKYFFHKDLPKRRKQVSKKQEVRYTMFLIEH